MYILGISAFFHDSAACLLYDGRIIAAAQEEIFTRIKHDSGFPSLAVEWCLREAGIDIQAVDRVVFYEKPFLKFERIVETSLLQVPFGLSQYMEALPVWINHKLWTKPMIAELLGYTGQILFVKHHQAHAASAFYPSPFETAAFLTIDGVGERETTAFGVCRGNSIETTHIQEYPHSVGLLYSAFTQYAGFKVNSGEYKLMGLAPYGRPIYTDLILNNLMDLKSDGSFRLNMKYFGFCRSLSMINGHFEELWRMPARIPESAITQEYLDIAASIQHIIEDIILKMAKHVKQLTDMDDLCIAGGVAHNCVANGRLLKDKVFKRIWVQPACGDAGGALGAALWTWHYLGNDRRRPERTSLSQAPFLGPMYKDSYIEDVLKEKQLKYQRVPYENIPDIVAQWIERGKVVGWFQGRGEYGPRALGARSILADARSPSMQQHLNDVIKHRETFRPFAPTILAEHVHEWFDCTQISPYMNFVFDLNVSKQLNRDDVGQAKGLDKFNITRSVVPAVTHVDYSARIQTITQEDHALFYDMIKAFYLRTGCPMVINTSFNVRGEPMVNSPIDALNCFLNTRIDYLAIGCFLLDKQQQDVAVHSLTPISLKD